MLKTLRFFMFLSPGSLKGRSKALCQAHGQNPMFFHGSGASGAQTPVFLHGFDNCANQVPTVHVQKPCVLHGFGAPGGLLEVTREHLGACWCHMKATWVHLGVTWELLGIYL